MKNTSLAIVTLFSTLAVAVMSSPAYAGHSGTPSFVACSCGGGDGGSVAADPREKLSNDDRTKDGNDITEQ